MSAVHDDDERLLARIGYKQVRKALPTGAVLRLIILSQELKREFSKWSTVSYAISILGVLGSVPATFGAPLAAGGPATAVWCWFLGSVMAFCIGSSVAELVSAYPTAGGMYFVTKYVVPEDQVPIFSWIQGWCNLLGQTAGVSSVAYTVSQMLLAAASMNSKLVDGGYSYTPYVGHKDIWFATIDSLKDRLGYCAPVYRTLDISWCDQLDDDKVVAPHLYLVCTDQ